MSMVVLTLPADRIEWGPVQPVAGLSCFQTGKVYVGDTAVCHLTLQWPTPEPSLAVLCNNNPRHAGPHD